MSGTNKIVVGEITQGNLRGKELADALAEELNELPNIEEKETNEK